MDEGYFSHIPLLAMAVLNTTGPVLELGAGLGSTLMLHGLCCGLERELTTLESNKEWLERFLPFTNSWHTIKEVSSFKGLVEYRRSWGLAFVDHGIMEQREDSIKALIETPIIVVHDTCHPWHYGYEPLLSTFKYRFDWQVRGPKTSIVSQTINVANLFVERNL